MSHDPAAAAVAHRGAAKPAAEARRSAAPLPAAGVERNAGSHSSMRVILRTQAAPRATAVAPVASTARGGIRVASLRAASGVERARPSSVERSALVRTVVSLRGGRHGVRMLRVSAPMSVEPAHPSIGQSIGLHAVDDPLDLRSAVALVLDSQTREPLYSKNPGAVLPIASITKLMTAMVVLDAGQSPTDMLEVTDEDVDTEKNSRSRLRVGSRLSRSEMLQAALMASENRAAHALGRYYPGGLPTFVAAMNRKAASLGMVDSQYVDPTGLSSRNVSTAQDLARMVAAASTYAAIREYSTSTGLTVDNGYHLVSFHNTNRLVDSPDWDIAIQKTGFINEAGNCLVMQTRIEGRPVTIVLLDGIGRGSRIADAQRLRRWLEASPVRTSAQPSRVLQNQALVGS